MNKDHSPIKTCKACNGRGYRRCGCWPADCLCGHDGDYDCEACFGEGVIDTSYDDEGIDE